MRVVEPPSTSFSPSEPPALPWPVKKHWVPAAVLSFSGWAAVPMGSPRSQMPVVASSPGMPAVQPEGASKASSAAFTRIWEAAVKNTAGASAGSKIGAPEASAAAK